MAGAGGAVVSGAGFDAVASRRLDFLVDLPAGLVMGRTCNEIVDVEFSLDSSNTELGSADELDSQEKK